MDCAQTLVKKYNQSAWKWMTFLEKESKSVYGLALLQINSGRWKRVQVSLARILQTQPTFKMVQAKYRRNSSFSKETMSEDSFFIGMVEA